MNLRYHVNLFRRFPHWNKRRCIFIHVPKAAGTSINRAIYGRTLGHYTAQEIRSTFPILYSRSFVFSVVRNPWDRLVSAYRFAKIGSTGTMAISNPELYQREEFRTFESFLFEWLAFQNLETVDFVFRPQHVFLTNDLGDLIVDYVGKVEQMPDVISKLTEAMGKEIALRRDNATNHNGHYSNYYKSSRCVDFVANLYARDIELFEYDFHLKD